MRIILAVAFVAFASNCLAEEKHEGPCKEIKEVCEKAGFVKDKANEGYGPMGGLHRPDHERHTPACQSQETAAEGQCRVGDCLQGKTSGVWAREEKDVKGRESRDGRDDRDGRDGRDGRERVRKVRDGRDA